jgi:hypothetical protein
MGLRACLDTEARRKILCLFRGSLNGIQHLHSIPISSDFVCVLIITYSKAKLKSHDNKSGLYKKLIRA